MKLFEPLQVKSITFQNRIVMAPMVPFGVPELTSGVMSKELLDHYLSRADNDMGLLIVQAMSVTPTTDYENGVGIYRTGIFSQAHQAPLKAIADTFHVHGSKVFVQLGYPSMGYDFGASIHQFSIAEMQHIRDAFIAAAQHCKEAGCDGVELHGAHGFFLNMMTSDISNQREDVYGGSFENRLRLVREIVEGIREFTDDTFIISYRMGWCSGLEKDIETAQALEAMGVEMLHISFGIPSSREIPLPKEFVFNEIVYTGTQIKKQVNIPVIVVNDIQTINRANAVLEQEQCDFAAFGRPFLADSAFLKHSQTNYDHAPCLGCKTCMWLEHYEKCPALKRTSAL